MAAHLTVREVFDSFVQNFLPIYLLHLPTITLTSRDEIKANYQGIAQLEKEFEGQEIDEQVENEVVERLKKEFRYATLSHRWGDGEPTFKDLSETVTRTEVRNRLGFKKLEMFCEKANMVFGCQWAWADMCCINKGSSAEHEESIRSMFNWYQNAAVGIIFLWDVDVENWRKSAWFLRGWTLQELLAPRQIKIFVKKWKPLTGGTSNDKEDDRILQDLWNVTHIPIGDLRRFEPGLDRVREKMVWASERRTTRAEDMAYCLIGIFDISLPISYGEGNRAFYRLQAEIMRNSNDWGLLLWEGHPSKYNSAIASDPRCFKPIESSSITSILISIAADIAPDMIHNGWQTFRDNTVVNYRKLSLIYEGRSVPVAERHYRRPVNLGQVEIGGASKAATKSVVNTIRGHQQNVVYISLSKSSGAKSLPILSYDNADGGKVEPKTVYENQIMGNQHNHIYAIESDWSVSKPGLVSAVTARSFNNQQRQWAEMHEYANVVLGNQYNVQVAPVGLVAEDLRSQTTEDEQCSYRRELLKVLNRSEALAGKIQNGVPLGNLNFVSRETIRGDQYNFIPVITPDYYFGVNFTVVSDGQDNYIHPGQLAVYQNRIQGDQHNVMGSHLLEKRTVRRNHIQGNQYNTIHMTVSEHSLYRPTARPGDFNTIQGDQETRFVLSKGGANDLAITVICGDLTTDLAAVMGMASAFISDIDAQSDIDRDEDIVKHVRTHIQWAIDHAVFEATQQIDVALKKLDKDLGCNYDVQSRVRQYLHEYFSAIQLPPWIFRGLRDRNMTSTSAQTSFMLGQMGLSITLPIFQVTAIQAVTRTGNARIYWLEVEAFSEVIITTEHELLSHRSLRMAVLDSNEYAGFNILNDLPEGPQGPRHHQALLLRLIRADVQQYSKVITENIIHVEQNRGVLNSNYLKTVYVK